MAMKTTQGKKGARAALPALHPLLKAGTHTTCRKHMHPCSSLIAVLNGGRRTHHPESKQFSWVCCVGGDAAWPSVVPIGMLSASAGP